MEALETYFPDNKTRLLGDPERDYRHATRYMQNSDQQKIGTLSQSEWEVTCEHKNFNQHIFRKMRGEIK